MNGQGDGRGSLNIEREETLLEIPRGDEVLRLSFTKAKTGDGKDVSWHSLRVFWRNGAGEWCPGKQGITIRNRELRAVVDALVRSEGSAPHTAERPDAITQDRELDIPF
ncbi:MAG: PC4/YdbC family ssDNA-binding protein [Myxococcota bacterium]|nr:PC4/YdbC family ssDNA-binding protein [Myxococcota bacterium]